MSDKITIIDVAREMGIEINPELTWAVGAIVRDEYIAEYGESPIKDLRKKTHGAGSHCFAVYPAWWKDRIASHYRRLGSFSASQGRLVF